MTIQQLSAPSLHGLTGPITHYIGGRWTDPTPERLPVVYPATGSVIAEVCEADSDIVARATEAAHQSFQEGSWSRVPVATRAAALRRVQALLTEHEEELADLEIAHSGIPRRQVIQRHLRRAAANFGFFADFIEQASEPCFRQHPDVFTHVRHEPVGVAGLIAPWNAPLALASMKLAGALAFGNSVVLKPAETTPLSFVALMRILDQAGLPRGVVNLVNGRGAVTGEALVADTRTGVVTFTGGTATGRRIGEVCGRHLKKYVAELGGKSANIVFADASYDRALDAALLSIFSNNGQQCLAGSRLLLQRGIAERFLEDFVERASRLRVGCPRDAATDVGPLASAVQLQRVLAFADEARRSERAELLLGGHALDADGGFFFAPTIALSHDHGQRLCQEEIFGPFATCLVFDDEEEAFHLANDTVYGLVSYLWTSDTNRMHRAMEALRAGVLWINTPMNRELRAPFGGFGASGVGRDGGAWSRATFTEEKTVTQAIRDFPLPALGK